MSATPEDRDRFVYSFSPRGATGDASMKNLLGGKGANLAEMSNLGLPVPPGFTLTTEVSGFYHAQGGAYPEGLEAAVDAALQGIADEMGTTFGDATNPLLLSVRSGARQSMPGMMETVLNVGLTTATLPRSPPEP